MVMELIFIDLIFRYAIVRNPLIGWCQLCQKLNDPTEPVKSYASLPEYWFDQAPCLDGTTYLQWVLPSS